MIGVYRGFQSRLDDSWVNDTHSQPGLSIDEQSNKFNIQMYAFRSWVAAFFREGGVFCFSVDVLSLFDDCRLFCVFVLLSNMEMSD